LNHFSRSKLSRHSIHVDVYAQQAFDVCNCWRQQWRVPKATKSGALDALRSNIGIIYPPRGRIALAITCHEMPEVNWTVDNAAMLLMSRLSEILIEELGSQGPAVDIK
jgi:hypothetical protein